MGPNLQTGQGRHPNAKGQRAKRPQAHLFQPAYSYAQWDQAVVPMPQANKKLLARPESHSQRRGAPTNDEETNMVIDSVKAQLKR